MPRNAVVAVSIAAAAFALAILFTAAFVVSTRRTAKQYAQSRRDLEATTAAPSTPHHARAPASQLIWGGDLGARHQRPSATTHASSSLHPRPHRQSATSDGASPWWKEGLLPYVEIDLTDMRPQGRDYGK